MLFCQIMAVDATAVANVVSICNSYVQTKSSILLNMAALVDIVIGSFNVRFFAGQKELYCINFYCCICPENGHRICMSWDNLNTVISLKWIAFQTASSIFPSKLRYRRNMKASKREQFVLSLSMWYIWKNSICFFWNFRPLPSRYLPYKVLVTTLFSMVARYVQYSSSMLGETRFISLMDWTDWLVKCTDIN